MIIPQELFNKPPDPVIISQIEEGMLDFDLITDAQKVKKIAMKCIDGLLITKDTNMVVLHI